MTETNIENGVLDVFIDLETLDTKPGAIIISVGAAATIRHSYKVFSLFERNVTEKDQQAYGATYSESTLAWWRKQSNEVWIQTRIHPLPMNMVLHNLAKWMNECRERAAEQGCTSVQVWGNGATMDISLLEWHFNHNPKSITSLVKAPWEFWDIRDVRTLVEVDAMTGGKEFKKRTTFYGMQHRSLHDAMHEMCYCARIMSMIAGRREDWHYLEASVGPLACSMNPIGDIKKRDERLERTK